MQSNYNGPFSKDKEWGGIYFCVQNNSFVHEEESTADFFHSCIMVSIAF